MKKNLLTLAILGLAAFGSTLNAAESEFTYADGELFPFGKGKAENIDVAMCIQDPSLVGKRITKILAYINTVDGISNTSVWLSNNLTLENKVNVPDIDQWDVTPVVTTVGKYQLGTLEYTLSDPYVLTEDPLYVGYSITVDDNKTDGQKYPVVLSQGNTPEGLYVHMSKSVLKWTPYVDKAGGVAYIVVYIEGDFAENALSLQNSQVIYAEDNEEFTGAFVVSNLGASPIENIDYTYTYDDDETVYEGYVELEDPIQPSISLTSMLYLPFEAISGTGPHDLNLTVTKVNGEINEAEHNSLSCTVNVIPFMPQHRPLIEEYTGLWCGWCPRGYIAMEEIALIYGDSQVSICYHNGDPMEVTTSYPVKVTGFPNSTVDRISLIDPYYGADNSEFGIANYIEARMEVLAIADIELEATLEGNTVNVESSTRFIQDIEDANYQVGYVLTCNGLSSPKWGQSNYFAGSTAEYAGTILEPLTRWPDTVLGLVFNDVAVDVDAMSGIPGSIPASIKTGQEYTNSYSFNIAGNDLIPDPENLVVAAFIINKNNGQIVNANKYMFNPDYDYNGVEELQEATTVVSTEYYDLTGRKVNNPGNGIYVVKEKNSNGTFKTSKVLIRK